MAWQVGSACYGTETAAGIAQASALAGSVVQHGSTAVVVGVQAVGPTSITYTFSPVDGSTPLTFVAPFTPQPCQLLSWSDGAELGWLVAGVWLAVAGVQFLARGLFGNDDARDNA